MRGGRKERKEPNAQVETGESPSLAFLHIVNLPIAQGERKGEGGRMVMGRGERRKRKKKGF